MPKVASQIYITTDQVNRNFVHLLLCLILIGGNKNLSMNLDCPIELPAIEGHVLLFVNSSSIAKIMEYTMLKILCNIPKEMKW